jgi:CRISPR-associated protein Csy1
MVDKAINEFFQVRKEAWLKKVLNTSMTEAEVKEKELECDQVFALEQWLPKAAIRAKSRAISSHPSKFSHPSTGIGKDNRKNTTYVTPIVCSLAKRSSDGYLRTGNIQVALDSIGNAGELDVDSFLNLVASDGRTLLEHLIKNTSYIQQLFAIKSENYNTLRNGLLAMLETGSEVETSSKIKQVYFPVLDGYHLLSTLTASGLVFELKARCRLAEEAKIARDKRKVGEYHKEGYSQVTNITVIGYGGGNPWNISELNKSNYGESYLLSSAPPKLHKRDIQFPSTDFFGQSINYYQCRDLFFALHELFLKHKNNWQVRAERDEYYQTILDRIIERMWSVRSVSEQQYNPDTNRLNKTQKTWLCAEHAKKREDENDWLDDLCKSVTSFMFHGYTKTVGKKAFMFSDEEFQYIHKQAVKNKEALR